MQLFNAFFSVAVREDLFPFSTFSHLFRLHYLARVLTEERKNAAYRRDKNAPADDGAAVCDNKFRGDRQRG